MFNSSYISVVVIVVDFFYRINYQHFALRVKSDAFNLSSYKQYVYYSYMSGIAIFFFSTAVS